MQKLHPKSIWIFFFSYFWAILFLSLVIFGGFIFPVVITLTTIKLNPLFFIPVLFIFYIVFLLLSSYLFAYLAYKNWKYELSEKALKIEKGIIWKKYISIPYTRIQNVDIYRGLLSRILGLSDIQIQTAGYSGYARGRGFSLSTEGRLPGLDPVTAENLRENLVQKIDGAPQGL